MRRSHGGCLVCTTKAGTLLRNSITVRKAGDEVEAEPGFFEVDTVAHRGPTLKGEFARTVNFTDMHTGWVLTHAIRMATTCTESPRPPCTGVAATRRVASRNQGLSPVAGPRRRRSRSPPGE